MNYFGRLITIVYCWCIFSDTVINLFSKTHLVTTIEEAIAIGRRILTLKYPGIQLEILIFLYQGSHIILLKLWLFFFKEKIIQI